MKRIGITGTDTGVGKTVVSTALLAMLRARGRRVAGMKPIETGLARGDASSDAAALRAAAGDVDPEAWVCPVVLPEPLAPWIAARRAGHTIRLEVLDDAVARLSDGRDLVVIEGAGGLLVPITREVRFDTLFQRWGAGVIVVALDRLGVLNHTLLTVQSARSAGLAVHGIVLNEGSATVDDLSRESNRAALEELLPDVPIAMFPRLADARDWTALAEAAERHGLDAVLPAGLGAPNESLDG
jgi:dethiobiotin synthetase